MRTIHHLLGVVSFPVILCLVGISTCVGRAAEPIPTVRLVADGTATAAIILPDEPTDAEALAAKELITHLASISGATLVSAPTAPAAGMLPIRLGAAASATVRDALEAGHPGVDGAFLLRVSADGIDIAGHGEGVAYGVYELLEQLGVRWFMPGDLGTVIPHSPTVELATQSTMQAPSFVGRNFQMGWGDWQTRLRCGGMNFPGAHGFPGFNNPKANAALFAEHPEYFAEIKGKRVNRQLCISNPEVLKLVIANVKATLAKSPGRNIIGMGPNDGSGFCECAECRKLDADDFDAFSGEPSVTDRYIWFFNQVLKGIEDEYPTCKIGFYIYHTYMRPPVREKPDPRITGSLAPIALCRIHGPNNPVCPEKQYYEWLVTEWGKIMPELWDRGYWSNLSDPGMPFILVHRLREQIPFGKAHGIFGWRVETFGQWASQCPSMYIAGKLMWNAGADVDALLADYHEKFFGPAAAPMARYTELIDHALRDADFHTGSCWDTANIYTPALRTQARELLDEAARLTVPGPPDVPYDGPASIYARRVALIRQSFAMGDAFCEMMEARLTGDFKAGYDALQIVDARGKELIAYDPPMLDKRTHESYMKRFFRLPTEQGYARVSDGNRLIARCADEWEFLLDTANLGESLHYERPTQIGPNWQRIKTISRSWSDQGLRYYKGLAWYRQRVEVPAEFVGQRVFLWCGGVDEVAKVWVNGTPVGVSHGAAIYPFELDATPAIKAGTNTIVFAVNNVTVNELGTGGILAPVILYAPKDGADAKLQNVRALKETFP